MSGNVETYYENGAWRNWVDGEEVGRAHTSRDDAVAEGRELAEQRDAEHIVRDEQATVVDRRDHD